jgi:acetyl-CoA synthetase
MPAQEDLMQATGFPFGQAVVWQPRADWMEASNLASFMHRHSIDSYEGLLRRATDKIEWFWNAVVADLGIQFEHPYSRVVDLSEGPAFARWCVDGRMNVTVSCLDKWVNEGHGERIALCWEGEEGATRSLTYTELLRAVEQCTAGLRAGGLRPGDVVGLFMPMVPDLAVAFLAIARMGAIILPLFSGYGEEAIRSRLIDAGARAVVTADGFFRRGAVSAMKDVLDRALVGVSTVEYVFVVPRIGNELASWVVGRDRWWIDLVQQRGASSGAAESTSAEDVLMLIYTSGTTGTPKGAVHTHCGFPIKAAQDLRHCFDLKRGDRLFWLTDMGWMMGPWEVFGALLNGATMLFYDGAPDYPGPGRLWEMVERHAVTHLGVSPPLIRALKGHGTAPMAERNLSSLRMVGSTGSPWDPDSWNWLFEQVLAGEKPIINYSGGTEVSGGIVCGNLFTPLKPCSFGGPIPGMDADVVDEVGAPMIGAVGELVIRQPWIGMTRGFWHDRERYLETYWSKIPDVWVHGDFAAIDEDGLWYLLGRSDDTIKVSGKRLGPSEVEVILAAHEAVLDCAVIGAPNPVKDNEIVAFCILRPGVVADESLREQLSAAVVRALGKPMKPRKVLFVSALPRTRNGKVMRRVVRAAWLGEPAGDLSSLENPAAVEAIRDAN